MKPKLQAPKPNQGRLILAGLVGLVLLGGIVSFFTSGKTGARRSFQHDDYISVTLPPLPPPPPPPPPPETPPPPDEDKMVEQPPVDPLEEPPDDTPMAAPPEDIGSGSPGGTGPAIGGKGSGNTIGGNRRNSGSQFGWYAAKVQSSLADALRQNPATRAAAMSLQVRIWPDASGRITRVQLIGTSGNAAVDDAIKNKILTGHQLPQAPPAGMPSPIVLRINARHPSP